MSHFLNSSSLTIEDYYTALCIVLYCIEFLMQNAAFQSETYLNSLIVWSFSSVGPSISNGPQNNRSQITEI